MTPQGGFPRPCLAPALWNFGAPPVVDAGVCRQLPSQHWEALADLVPSQLPTALTLSTFQALTSAQRSSFTHVLCPLPGEAYIQWLVLWGHKRPVLWSQLSLLC